VAGVRLHHPELRSCTFTITNHAIPLVAPMFCWSCSGGPEGTPTPRRVIHTHKTYHLAIDAAGDVVVAEELVEAMRGWGLLREAGLFAVRGVPNPDAQVIQHGVFEVPTTVDREAGVLG
jgi:hypothetical protein